MKKILYLAQTINGYIAKENDEAPWSNVIFNSYYSNVKNAGNLIVGRRTYQIMKKHDELRKCGNPFTIIVTKSLGFKPASRAVTANSPTTALKMLNAKRFKEVIIAGGSKLATSFMEQRLIDEIWLDIEPMVLGKGIPLFHESKLEAKLRLIKTVKLSKNIIRLCYKVLK